MIIRSVCNILLPFVCENNTFQYSTVQYTIINTNYSFKNDHPVESTPLWTLEIGILDWIITLYGDEYFSAHWA